MSDRERIRRPEPVRTEPVRHPSAAFRGDARSPGPSPSPAAPVAATPDAPASARAAAPDPFAWQGDDPVSRAVRAGCEVVETAVRRGFGLGRYPGATAAGGTAGAWGSANGTSWPGAWSGGQPGWSTGQWVDAMTGAVTLWAQWIDAWSAIARSVITGGAEPAGAWSGPRAPSPPAPASAAAGTRALHLTVELRTARAASVQLDLASVPAPAVALEVHGLLAPPVAAAPPITDVTVSVAADGGVTVALGSIEHHPAGTYAGAVLAAGRACGTLTVRLT